MKTQSILRLIVTCLALLISLMTSQAANLTWDADPNTTDPQDGAGTWDTTTNTWWDGVANVLWDNVTPANAIFGVGNGAAGIGLVSNTAPVTVGNITFNATSGGNYTINGSAANVVTLSGSPTITANVDAALNVVLTGTSFTKEGSGQLSLRPLANNTYTGTTTVNAGTLALNSSTSGRILIAGNLIINPGTTVTNTGSAGPVADSATVTVGNGATYATGTGSETINSLVLDGGTVSQGGTATFICDSVDARSGSMVQLVGGTGKLDCNTFTKTTSGAVTLTTRGSAAASGGLTNTIVDAGTITFDYTQNSSKLNDTGTLTVNGGTLIQVNGTHSETVGAVTLTGGVITNAGGTARINLTTGSYDVRSGAVYTVLSGAAGLTKTTPGTVIVAATNNYSGGTTISDGILQLGDGSINGSINSGAIVNNAMLILNPSASAVTVAINGTGSLTKTGSGTASLTQINTYQGSTTISNGVLSIDSDATLGDATGALVLAGGTLNSTASRSAVSAPVANPVNLVADSAITTTSASGTGATADFNLNNDSVSGSAGTLTFRNDAASGNGIFAPRFSSSGFNFSRPIVIANGAFGTTRLDSFNVTGTTQTFSGDISGSGSYRRNASTAGSGGTTIFAGQNTYAGATDVNRGVVLVNGSLGSSTVSVGANGTLGGNGTIHGPVTVLSGGTLAAGTSIGTLTISNSLTLSASSTNQVEVNKTAGTADLVRGLTSVSYNGRLVVENLSGTLTAGDSFPIFSATTPTGNFVAIDGTPGPGLNWSFDPITGILSVVSADAPPTLGFTQAGNLLTFSWTGSFKLQAQTNSASVGISTPWFDYPSGNTSPVNVTIDPDNANVFFRLAE